MEQVEQVVDQLADAQQAMASLEGDFKDAKAHVKNLSETVLPDLMDQVGLKSLETRKGLKVKVSENIRASIPHDKELDAFAWLEDNGHASVIKNQIVITLNRGDDALADQIADYLDEQGVLYERKRGVHPMTLGALIKELLEEGVPVPLEVFGAFHQRIAKIGK